MATIHRGVSRTAFLGIPPALPSWRSVLTLPLHGPSTDWARRGGHAATPSTHVAPVDRRILAEAVERVRREYVAWPTLRLTAPQVRRLFGFSDALCTAVLGSLLSPGFLARTSDGQYCRGALDG